jgi:hypothetical protein
MSEKNRGGHDYVPTSTVVQCTVCEAATTLLPGDIIRKHLNPALGTHLERRDRICTGSRTDQWRKP